MTNFSEFNSAKIEEEIELKGSCHSFTFDKEKNAFLLCNSTNQSIDVYQSSQSSSQYKLKLSKIISVKRLISSIVYDKFNNRTFIGQMSNRGISILDNDFNTVKTFGKKEINYEYIDYITIDDEENNDILYVCSTNNGKLAKLNSRTGVLLDEKKICLPESLVVKNDKLFLIGRCESKNDFLFILDKNSLEILNKIKLKNKRKIYGGLCIDKFSNIILTAKDKNDEETINIFILNNKGEILKEFPLNEIEKSSVISDMTIVENNIYLLSQEEDFQYFLNKITFQN